MMLLIAERFKTIPDEQKDELARALIGMFPLVIDCLTRTGEELSETWFNYVAPLKKDGHHVDSDSEDPTAYDADIRDAIKDCFVTLRRVESVLCDLGMH